MMDAGHIGSLLAVAKELMAGTRVRGEDPLGERQRIYDYLSEMAGRREEVEQGRGLVNMARQMNFVETHTMETIEDKYPALIEKVLGRSPRRKLKVLVRDMGTPEEPDWQLVDIRTREVLKDGIRSEREAIDYGDGQGWLLKFERRIAMGTDRRIEAIASRLVAVKSNFTVIKPLQLVREGATRDSLENARRLQAAGYGLVNGSIKYDLQGGNWDVVAYFYRDVDNSDGVHIFKGFSFGYGGEGPRGLMEFLKMFGWGADSGKVTSKDWVRQERGDMNLKDFA